jgi:hypothetical protein
MTVVALADLLGRPAGWLMLCCLWPLAPLFKELVLWNAEQYVIIDLPSGGSVLRKEFSILSWGKSVEDNVTHLAPTTLSTPLGRFLGYESVQLSSVNKVYFKGERVPVELMREMRKSPRKAKDPIENERAMIISNLDGWIASGLIDLAPARAVVRGMVEDNL